MRALPHSYAEVPADAIVDPMQAESALGHNLAGEIDEEIADILDKDVRAEEEAMLGALVNPAHAPYGCLAPGEEYMRRCAERLGLDRDGPMPVWSRADLSCTTVHASKVLEDSAEELQRKFERGLNAPGAADVLSEKVAALDPTQRAVYDTMTRRAELEAAASVCHGGAANGSTCDRPAPLRMLVVGAAGTGKTFILMCAIDGVRR